MNKRILTLTLVFAALHTFAQTDYTNMANWYYHPDKSINLLANYNLDVAIVNKDLSIDSTISIANNSTVNTGIDIFWVHPTQLTNPPDQPGVVALSEQPFSLISSTIIAQGALLAKYGRFYAPRYQQSTPAAFLSNDHTETERAEALMTTYRDVKAAFVHYLNTQNNGNRIILAGHSQGSFLLAMLLRDVIDQDENLRSKLIAASLAGMPYIHAEKGSFKGGQFENIPLCTTINECGCIHSWRSFKETQILPTVVSTLPIFSNTLVDSGVVYRTVDLQTDWFVQDSLLYNENSAPLRYYISPDATYKLSPTTNFVAFDSFYTARFKRLSNHRIALALDYPEYTNDQRPNDLKSVEQTLNFLGSGYHQKDYHIYLWALLQQLDAKVNNCQTVSVVETKKAPSSLSIYPNPSSGRFTVQLNQANTYRGNILIYNSTGTLVFETTAREEVVINLPHSGIYLLQMGNYRSKLIVK